MSKIKLKKGKSYIFKSVYVINMAFKAKVTEITKTSICIKQDDGSKGRYLKNEFFNTYEIVEELGSKHGKVDTSILTPTIRWANPNKNN